MLRHQESTMDKMIIPPATDAKSIILKTSMIGTDSSLGPKVANFIQSLHLKYGQICNADTRLCPFLAVLMRFPYIYCYTRTSSLRSSNTEDSWVGSGPVFNTFFLLGLFVSSEISANNFAASEIRSLCKHPE